MDEIYIVGIRAKVVFALNTQTNRIQWLCLLFACLYVCTIMFISKAMSFCILFSTSYHCLIRMLKLKDKAEQIENESERKLLSLRKQWTIDKPISNLKKRRKKKWIAKQNQ